MNNSFSDDYYRCFGNKKYSLFKFLLFEPELKYMYYFRKCHNSKSLLLLYYRFRLKLLSRKTHIQISYKTNIGSGFYIGHCGRLIINQNAIIGNNVNVATGVTIGQESRGKRKGSPKIGNDCWIGTNSVIVGNIQIGNDVLIAPLSFVNFDVPDHSIVIGNPARIISKTNATEGYILNKVD